MQDISSNFEAGTQKFGKYEELGAYHWAAMKPSCRISFDPYMHARYSGALKQVPPTGGVERLAVDLGCGDGYFSNLLVGKGYRVAAVDGSKAAIELAETATPTDLRHKINFKAGNVYATDLPAASADLIVSLDVIEHLDRPLDFLREIQRIGKPGCLVIIGTPVRFSHEPVDKYHVKEFFVEELRTFLQDYMNVEEIKRSHPMEWMALMGWSFPVFGKKKYLIWNLINIYFRITGHNPLESNSARYPTYQFAICRLKGQSEVPGAQPLPPPPRDKAAVFTSFRRHYLDKALSAIAFSGDVLDVGGKHAGKKGNFRPPVERCRTWRTVNIDPAAMPDFLASADALPLPAGDVDHVLLADTFEHLEFPEKALAEAHRVLRKGGRLELMAPFLYPVHGDPQDFQRWTPEKYRRELVRQGFADVRVQPMGGLFAVAGDSLEAFCQAHYLSGRPLPLRFRIARKLVRSLLLGTLLRLDSALPFQDVITGGYFVTAWKP